MPPVVTGDEAPQEIDIFWWNIHDYFHYDPSIKKDRWPKSKDIYDEKCRRVDTAFNAFFEKYKKPEIIILCEITKKAALDLGQRLFSDYKFFSLDTIDKKPTLQICMFYKPSDGIGMHELLPIVVEDMPDGSRPMAVLQITKNNQHIRIVACHWTARIGDDSESYREKAAQHLSKYSYDYLIGPNNQNINNHIIIIGDLNDEPFDRSLNKLYAHRHRERSLSKHHRTDKSVSRVHLYNCTWRMLGEKSAFDPKVDQKTSISGSYYWEEKKSWYNLDQLIVSKGLISSHSPYIDEGSTQIVSLPQFLPDRKPKPFTFIKSEFFGLSDHLPIHTKVIF
ncbi:hypothetical protein ACJJWD_13765 [Comamonas testosteroni]|uniref:endonuclease/exonuclease/phosphatase family protein n=1 Tax=Comamonas testosteroni TaxID=285 RepID=UPI00389A56CA